MSRWDRFKPAPRNKAEEEGYRIVEAKLISRTSDAIYVETKTGRRAWVPRSLLHGADEIKAGVAMLGHQFVFRVMDWKAEEIGLGMSDLPQNLLAERGLLGIILNNNDAMYEVGHLLTKADFAEPYNGELFILFKDLIEAGRGVSAVSVLHDAQDAVIWGELKASEYLAMLERDAPVSRQVERAGQLAITIRDAALNSRVITALDELSNRIRSAPASIPAVVLRDDVDAAITALFQSSTELGLEDVADVGDRLLGQLKDAADREIGRPLGLAFVQNLTGPAMPGRLLMLGGPSGSGKSALMAQVARYDAQQGGFPILFTREMRSDEVVSRLLSADTGIKGDQIERNMLNPTEYQALWDANEKMRGLQFKIASPNKFTLPYIRARAIRQQRLSGLTMVLVDHAHLMGKSDRRMSDYEALNENLEGLKGMAMDLSIPVIAACQLTGEALKDLNRWPHRPPIFTDLLFSAAIDRNADIVVIIHRLEHVLRRNEPRKEDDPVKHGEWAARLEQVRGMVDAILTKRRGGVGDGNRVGYFDRERVLFSDRPLKPVNERADLWSHAMS